MCNWVKDDLCRVRRGSKIEEVGVEAESPMSSMCPVESTVWMKYPKEGLYWRV